MNSSVNTCAKGFALEVWSGVPGVACSGAAGAFGYLLLPFLQGGVIGDFTIENAAVTFTVTGATTKDGNGWGVGPHKVMPDAAGAPAVLPNPLDPDDHLVVLFTTIAPPAETDGCVDLAPAVPFATGATEVAGAAGTWTPPGNQPIANVPNLIAGTPAPVTASPLGAWGAGSYMQTAAAGASGQAYWNGTAWVAGKAPVVVLGTGTQGAPGSWTGTTPADFAALTATAGEYVASPTSAWTTGNYVDLGDATDAYWSGTAWTVGQAP